MARRPNTALGRAETTNLKRAQLAATAPQLRLAAEETSAAGEKHAAGKGSGAGFVTETGPAVTWERVPLALIDIPADRLRKVDMAWAEVLGKSMRDDRQWQPVRLVREPSGRFTVSLGAHRVAGAQLAGLAELDAGWVHRDWADASSSRIPEIVENLIRNDLDALERAHHLAEYQAIHETLHPESGHGGDRRSQARRDQVAMLATWSFGAEAAEKTGLSERAVRRALQIWNGLSAASREALEGTAIARNQAALMALATIAEPLQGKVIALLLKGEAASVGDALLLAQGKRPPAASEKLFKSVSSGFGRLNARARATIWETYEDEIVAHFRKKGILP